MVNDEFTSFLSSLRNQKVYYIPSPGTAGDGFIAHATYYMLDHFNIEIEIMRGAKDLENETILIGGGGNFIENLYHDVEKILWKYVKNNRCVVLPHTVYGHKRLLEFTDNNLKLFCREKVSYDLACAVSRNPSNVLLVHDMTFYLPRSQFEEFRTKGVGVAYCMRVDREAAVAIPAPNNNLDISLSWDGDIWHNRKLASYSTRSLAAYLASYETVVTDRLHVAILAAHLDKKVVLLPNSYFKNRAVFEHSLSNLFPNVMFVNSCNKVGLRLPGSANSNTCADTEDRPEP